MLSFKEENNLRTKKLHFQDGVKTSLNKMGQPHQCGATLTTPVSFTYKLAFYIHNVGKNSCKKKSQRNSKSQDFQKFGHKFPRLNAFYCFIFIEKKSVLKIINIWAKVPPPPNLFYFSHFYLDLIFFSFFRFFD